MAEERRHGPAVTVQVVAYAPTVFRHCTHCEIAFGRVGVAQRVQQEEAATALPAELIEEYRRVSDWVHALHERHGGRVRVSVVDAASLGGVWTSLRYGVRRFPAVIVNGRERVVGGDLAAADRLIEDRLAERTAGSAGVGRGAA